MGTGNYSATSNNLKLVHWPLTGGLLHLVQWEAWEGCSPSRPLLTVPNVTYVTAHPSTASVSPPITVLLYNGPFLCDFNAPINTLTRKAIDLSLHRPMTHRSLLSTDYMQSRSSCSYQWQPAYTAYKLWYDIAGLHTWKCVLNHWHNYSLLVTAKPLIVSCV